MSEIGYFRKENNLDQSQFAQSIGISQGKLSEIEMGNSNPSADGYSEWIYCNSSNGNFL
ncbi:helix-turn-helix domain-containing protein [Paenibacillus sp. KQZ6P-2]|uniref:Helix-turn-helix domain-containing protein n=1 Tax=Paenibacillus mangrovi TaxID=2931978 RepID=A0A9X2B396_9BACL|nr:helix-turn-helix transcriptional regulator [Paenibacillus mangrovi]MCJ8013424.1 helix-turn-helix domain-containing protein [Paenibacillus mangrovi]